MNSWYKISKKSEHSYSWVFIDLPKDIQEQIIDFGKEIDEDDLYTKEADGGLEKDPHITVKYGLLTEDAKDPKDCIKGLKGGKVYLGSSSIFEGEKYDVVKITVESKDLERIHNELNKLPHEDKHMDYQAHATIAYVKSGCGKKYKGRFKLNKRFCFKDVFFGNNERDFKIKLASHNFITIQELENLAKNTPYSLLQCVDCGRWIDMGKKRITEWKLESEMSNDELQAVSETKKAIQNGRGSGWSTCKYCRMSSSNINWYKTAKTAKDDKEPLNPQEREQVKSKFGDKLECSFAKDKDGYYCYTHRARSDSYPSIEKIPQSVVDFIGSTG